MNKKILLGLGSALVVVAGVAGLAAFEAHVINVTAKIENALSVPFEEINFGTVFPQEELYEGFSISLSDSFIAEDRVDDVKYMIRQKPKCAITTDNGTVMTDDQTATGHRIVDPQTGEIIIDCGEPPRTLVTGEKWGLLPSLCEYLSKHKDGEEGENDQQMDAFHKTGYVKDAGDVAPHYVWVWNSLNGYLAKSDNDITDNWILDLKVPCFGGHCAQDWADFVAGINDSVDPEDYVLPIDDEHKIFGCDLWIEVTGISLPGENGITCEADVMSVLDRSGSIQGDEQTTLKDAAKAFVDALAPTTTGVHMGQSSFATNGSLDLHLTDDTVAIKAAIDGLSFGGYTNLKEGLEFATAELGDATYDRNDADSPDFMVVITDGAPNRPSGTAQADAEAAADVADADGIVIYVVGVGTSETTANWLKAEIATTPGHYFDAADWDDLEAILAGLSDCQD